MKLRAFNLIPGVAHLVDSSTGSEVNIVQRVIVRDADSEIIVVSGTAGVFTYGYCDDLKVVGIDIHLGQAEMDSADIGTKWGDDNNF